MIERNERTLRMMNHYVQLRSEGKSIAEIASIYGLSDKTIYSCLGDIAATHGCSREELLAQASSGHRESSTRVRRSTKSVGREDAEHFRAALAEMAAVAEEIQQQINNHSATAEQITKEESSWEH